MVWVFLIYMFYGSIGDKDIVQRWFDWKSIFIMHEGKWFMVSGSYALFVIVEVHCPARVMRQFGLHHTYLMMLTHLMTFMLLIVEVKRKMIDQWFIYNMSICGMQGKISYLQSSIPLFDVNLWKSIFIMP